MQALTSILDPEHEHLIEAFLDASELASKINVT